VEGFNILEYVTRLFWISSGHALTCQLPLDTNLPFKEGVLERLGLICRGWVSLVGVLGSFLLGSSFSGFSCVYFLCTLGLFLHFNKIAYL
jgi:hypothetical protein